MSNLIYPTLIGETFPIIKRPMFNTIAQKAASGLEVRIGLYTWPLFEWEIPYSWLSQEKALWDFNKLMAFYQLAYGQFGSFLFNDPNDNATDANRGTGDVGISPSRFATGDGVTRVFQLGRQIGNYSGNVFFNPVGAVNATARTPLVQINGTPTAAYTINNNTAVITFTSAPGAGLPLQIDFDYYWRVRFAEDKLDFANFVTNYWEVKKVYLQSVKAEAL